MSILSNKNKNNSTQDWFNKPWTKIVATVTGISLFFGIGFSAGQYKKSIECDLLQIKNQQEFNEKLQKEINDCRQYKMNKFEKSVEDIQTVVKLIQEKANAK